MKKLTFIFSLLFILACKTKQTGVMMSDFTFVDMQDKPFSQNDLSKEKPTIMIFFNPTCDHCEVEASSMVQRANEFKNINVTWVAVAEKPAMKTFDSTYQLSKNNMILLRDTAKSAGKLFNIKDVPSILFFDETHQLLSKYAGTLRIDKMLEEVKK